MIDVSSQRRLAEALRGVQLPRGLFQFSTGQLEQLAWHEDLERRLQDRLRAKDPDQVAEGLSGVLHWLFQVEGAGRDEIYLFRSAVRRWSLVEALRLFDWLEGPGLIQIENLRLPVFRDLATATALRMFLNPESRVCLRPLHLRLRQLKGPSVLHEVEGEEGRWPLTLFNEVCYERWCQICACLAAAMESETWRPVDMERALGQLIQEGEAALALHLVHVGESLRSMS